MKPAEVRRLLNEGMTRADIARRHGVSRQWVGMFIRDNLPGLHGKAREAALARGRARRDREEIAREKRQAFKAVLREARARGMLWTDLADALLEPNWKRLQALARDRA